MSNTIDSPAKCELCSVFRFLQAKEHNAAKIHRLSGEAVYHDRRTLPQTLRSVLFSIVMENVGYSQVCAWWVPKMLHHHHEHQFFFSVSIQFSASFLHHAGAHEICAIYMTHYRVNFRRIMLFSLHKSVDVMQLTLGRRTDHTGHFYTRSLFG